MRVGNAAVAQLQLDIYGEVLDALYQTRNRRLVSDASDWMLQIELLKHLEKIWELPDEGIWEVRGPRRHFTHSKVMAWVAFDRGVKSIEQFGFVGPLDHWQRLRQRIHDDVCIKGFDPEQGAFTQSYGVKQLDASLLIIALVGFLPPEDKRVRGTVDAIERHLIVDGFVRRYDTQAAEDGLPAGEGAFLACSFWLVDNLVLLGSGSAAANEDRALRELQRLVEDLAPSEAYSPADAPNAAGGSRSDVAGNRPGRADMDASGRPREKPAANSVPLSEQAVDVLRGLARLPGFLITRSLRRSDSASKGKARRGIKSGRPK